MTRHAFDPAADSAIKAPRSSSSFLQPERELLELVAQIDAATQRMLTLIRAIDESGSWRGVGIASSAHWLAWKCGMTPATARERLRVARALGDLPNIDEAFSKGLVSYSKVRAMTRVATRDNEKKLLFTAKAATAAQLEVVCRGLRTVGQEPRAEREPERWLIQKRGDGDLVRIEAQLHPDEAALLMKALDALRDDAREASAVVDTAVPSRAGAPADVFEDVSAEGSSEKATAPPRPSRADALVKLADYSLTARSEPQREAEPKRHGGDRATLFIHVTENDLAGARTANLEDGTRIPAETLRRIACDAGIVSVLTTEDGAPLDVGRKTRSIPPSIRRALSVRDRTCRFPGCDHRRWLDAHHIEHWLHGGETKLANLVSLCPFHHGLLHEGGFAVALDEERNVRFTDPEGCPIALEAPPPLVQDQAITRIRAANENAGAKIDHRSCESEWQGERPDYNYIVARLS